MSNSHIAVCDFSWAGGECAVYYSRDLRRVHSFWAVPGTLDVNE